MFWVPRTRRKRALEDIVEHDSDQRKATDTAGSEGRSSTPAPDLTDLSISLTNQSGPVGPITPSPPEENERDGTFPQQTPVAQYSLQGSLIWDVGPRTYLWLAGYGILRLWGGVAGPVKQEDEDGV